MLIKNKIFLLISVLISLWGINSFSCAVPVYRYGLERWEPDFYPMFFLYDKEVTSEGKEILDFFENNQTGKSSNLRICKVDISKKTNLADDVKQILDKFKPDKFPYAVIYYPEPAGNRIVFWNGKLTVENAHLLVESPVRREVARRILSGECAAWIFMESGNKEKDNSIYEKLSSELKSLEKELNNRPTRDPDAEKPPSGFDEDVMSLPVKTSIIRMSKEDPAEKYLVNLVAKIAPEKMEAKNFPVAIPVFSRGRMLDIVAADKINHKEISAIMNFLVGECSCEAKAMNPGVDMLMSVDWEAFVFGKLVVDQELPPLQGLGNIKPASAKVPTSDPSSPTAISHGWKILIGIVSALIFSFLVSAIFFEKIIKK